MPLRVCGRRGTCVCYQIKNVCFKFSVSSFSFLPYFFTPLHIVVYFTLATKLSIHLVLDSLLASCYTPRELRRCSMAHIVDVTLTYDGSYLRLYMMDPSVLRKPCSCGTRSRLIAWRVLDCAWQVACHVEYQKASGQDEDAYRTAMELLDFRPAIEAAYVAFEVRPGLNPDEDGYFQLAWESAEYHEETLRAMKA